MVKTKLRCAGASDPGRVRQNNEDAFHADQERGIFLVIDGIGGQAAGEKAAAIAKERIRARLERQTGSVEQRVREAITVANNEILRASHSNPEWEGMACVLTVAVLDDGAAVVGHVGDSRLYKIRGGEIQKITHDHSPVGQREDAGELTEAEAMRHPRRNEVFRDVGSEEHEPGDPDFIEILRIPFEPDSALLLCSDGLSDQVPSVEIRRIVERRAGDPETAARELIEAANRAGGKDNVTVLVVEGGQFTAPAAPVGAGRGSIFASRPAVFAYGLAVALAAAWFSRGAWAPGPPVVPPPRVLTAGSGAAFATISAALAEARPGDTVEAYSGEYREQVRLNSGVDLRTHNAILRAAPMSQGPAILAENVNQARIIGFRIEAAPGMPLAIGIGLTGSDVELDDLTVAGAETGIEIRGPVNPVLRGNTVRDCPGTGVLISGLAQPWMSHNVFAGNKVDLAARDGARPWLVGNVFEKNRVDLPAEISMDDVRANNLFMEAPRATGPRPVHPAGRPAPAHVPEAKK
ncbi:MAG: protein phosphatase 2C domain-containing protein [Acidobacteriia bacterium]|nr:protein phosphatase 2C domain-containing protein [Terriglobia bacterium]